MNPKKRYYGATPRNARVKIDYSGKKPKVTFSYPSKHQTQGSMLFWIIATWVIIFYLFGLIYGAIAVNYENIQPLKNMFSSKEKKINECKVRAENYIIQNQTEILNDACKGEFLSSSSDSYYLIIHSITRNINKLKNIESWVYLSFIFLPPFIIYLPFRKQWAKVYPKFMALYSRDKLAMFYSKDVELDNHNEWYCEIPLFSNVLLDYKAKDEFSKYLKFIEIREHKFRYFIEKRFKKMSKTRKKLRKRQSVNEWLWYAKFYFKEKPRTGKLEVKFR